MKTWKLFLDDERYPVDLDYTIARGFDDAVWYVKNYGLPVYMSLDHDLGPNRYTGMDFVKWFAIHVLDRNLDLPDGFGYYVHSQNPIGAQNMAEYMQGFLRAYKEYKV